MVIDKMSIEKTAVQRAKEKYQKSEKGKETAKKSYEKNKELRCQKMREIRAKAKQELEKYRNFYETYKDLHLEFFKHEKEFKTKNEIY
jgi:hypothetical protein